MRDLMTYATICMKELDAIGIRYGKILRWEVNTRAKSRWGQCRTVPGGFTININADLLDENNNEEGLKNTIIHELLHSVKGCHGHGANWKRCAALVNRTYGYNIKRCNSAEEKGVHRDNELIAKYILECTLCHKKIYKQRMTDSVRNPQCYIHGKCGGSLKRVL